MWLNSLMYEHMKAELILKLGEIIEDDLNQEESCNCSDDKPLLIFKDQTLEEKIMSAK